MLAQTSKCADGLSEANAQSSNSGPEGVDLSQVLKNQSKETTSAGRGIFNIPFKQIFWAKRVSQHIKNWFCSPSTSKLDWS